MNVPPASPAFVRQPDGSLKNPYNPYIHGPAIAKCPSIGSGSEFDGDQFVHWNGVPKLQDPRGYPLNPQPENPIYYHRAWAREEAHARARRIQEVADTYPNPAAAIAYLHSAHRWPDHAPRPA